MDCLQKGVDLGTFVRDYVSDVVVIAEFARSEPISLEKYYSYLTKKIAERMGLPIEKKKDENKFANLHSSFHLELFLGENSPLEPDYYATRDDKSREVGYYVKWREGKSASDVSLVADLILRKHETLLRAKLENLAGLVGVANSRVGELIPAVS